MPRAGAAAGNRRDRLAQIHGRAATQPNNHGYLLLARELRSKVRLRHRGVALDVVENRGASARCAQSLGGGFDHSRGSQTRVGNQQHTGTLLEARHDGADRLQRPHALNDPRDAIQCKSAHAVRPPTASLPLIELSVGVVPCSVTATSDCRAPG